MNEHVDAWPFRDPVDAHDVPDYYDIIKDPMGKALIFTCTLHFNPCQYCLGFFVNCCVDFFFFNGNANLLEANQHRRLVV